MPDTPRPTATPGLCKALCCIWRENRAAVLAFLLALGLMLFFGGRMALHALYWADPAHHRQQVEGWMTPGYVERSWDLPPMSLRPLLGLPQGGGKGMTLAQIAKRSGEPLESFLDRIEAEVERRRPAEADAPGQGVQLPFGLAPPRLLSPGIAPPAEPATTPATTPATQPGSQPGPQPDTQPDTAPDPAPNPETTR